MFRIAGRQGEQARRLSLHDWCVGGGMGLRNVESFMGSGTYACLPQVGTWVKQGDMNLKLVFRRTFVDAWPAI